MIMEFAPSGEESRYIYSDLLHVALLTRTCSAILIPLKRTPLTERASSRAHPIPAAQLREYSKTTRKTYTAPMLPGSQNAARCAGGSSSTPPRPLGNNATKTHPSFSVPAAARVAPSPHKVEQKKQQQQQQQQKLTHQIEQLNISTKPQNPSTSILEDGDAVHIYVAPANENYRVRFTIPVRFPRRLFLCSRPRRWPRRRLNYYPLRCEILP
jgi:hypothetical protein